jgi:hypothetical protein
MASGQIEEQTALIESPAVGDEHLINDISDTTDDAGGTTKKITTENLHANLLHISDGITIYELDEKQTPVAGDKLIIADGESAGQPKIVDWSKVVSANGGLTLAASYVADSSNKSVTLVVGEVKPINLSSASLNGNVIVSLPVSPSEGDRCALFIESESTVNGSYSQAPGFCVEFETGSNINGNSYTQVAFGSGLYGLWVVGERLDLISIGTSWFIENDLRKQQNVVLRQTTITNLLVENNYTDISNWITQTDIANQFDPINDLIEVKRWSGLSIVGCRFSIDSPGGIGTFYFGDCRTSEDVNLGRITALIPGGTDVNQSVSGSIPITTLSAGMKIKFSIYCDTVGDNTVVSAEQAQALFYLMEQI